MLAPLATFAPTGYAIERIHRSPDVRYALLTATGQLVEEFYDYATAELAAANLDAIADCVEPDPHPPIPDDVGDTPPPWRQGACADCGTTHHVQKCPALLALLFR